MKLISYRFASRARVGVVVSNPAVDLDPVLRILTAAGDSGETDDPGAGDMLALLRAGAGGLAVTASFAERALRDGIDSHPLLADVELLAPIPRPPKIVAIGRNYADHTGSSSKSSASACSSIRSVDLARAC